MLREASLVALLLVPFALASDGVEDPPPCANGLNVHAVHLTGVAHGCWGIPDGPPRGILVFAHGHGQSAANWTDHMQRYAERGYASIAMNYRGAWNEFPLRAGADDTRLAGRIMKASFPEAADPMVLFSVSMGGAVGGMVVAEDRSDLFDAWFMVEGLSMLAETWAEAKAAEPATAAEIERECGGTPLDVPEAYVERSPALRFQEIAGHGLDGAVLVHAVNDGRVPVDQGIEMAAGLRAINVPTETYWVLRGDPEELGSTGTGALGLGATDEHHHLAGHAWEGSSTHVVMATAFERLDRYLDGRVIGNSDHVVDEELGVAP